jgi:hypothetical protein
VFFLSTVVLIGFGMTLSLSRLSQIRWMVYADKLRREELRVFPLNKEAEEQEESYPAANGR